MKQTLLLVRSGPTAQNGKRGNPKKEKLHWRNRTGTISRATTAHLTALVKPNVTYTDYFSMFVQQKSIFYSDTLRWLPHSPPSLNK